MSTLTPPFNFSAWIATHRDQLKPPVANKVIWQDQDFICMVVGGPNQRTDFHFDEGPEFFYQIEGVLTLKIMEDGKPRNIVVNAGDIFLLPPRVPHSPQRSASSIGLVIERKRLAHEKDGLMWFCPACHHKIFEEYFVLDNIETQFPAVFARFYGSLAARTCEQCGHVHPAPEK
jgi:3-hydroxyanthranilate 3,4-dioxygenase